LCTIFYSITTLSALPLSWKANTIPLSFFLPISVVQTPPLSPLKMVHHHVLLPALRLKPQIAPLKCHSPDWMVGTDPLLLHYFLLRMFVVLHLMLSSLGLSSQLQSMVYSYEDRNTLELLDLALSPWWNPLLCSLCLNSLQCEVLLPALSLVLCSFH
jgi:hypothetical protein